MQNKTLQELEGVDWGEPEFDSYVVVNCHRLRRVPLRDFTVEDLRLMIGQHIGLSCLVPLALDHLERDPLIAGDLYEGDLLEAVRRVPTGFWDDHPVWRQRWREIASRAPVETE